MWHPCLQKLQFHLSTNICKLISLTSTFWKKAIVLFLCLLLEFTLQKTYMHTKVTVPNWIHTNYTLNNSYYNSFFWLILRKDTTEYHRNKDPHDKYPYQCTTKFKAISRVCRTTSNLSPPTNCLNQWDRILTACRDLICTVLVWCCTWCCCRKEI